MKNLKTFSSILSMKTCILKLDHLSNVLLRRFAVSITDCYIVLMPISETGYQCPKEHIHTFKFAF